MEDQPRDNIVIPSIPQTPFYGLTYGFMPKEAVEEIRSVINRHSLENRCDIPDHAIAEYLAQCYTSLCLASKQKVNWTTSIHGEGKFDEGNTSRF